MTSLNTLTLFENLKRGKSGNPEDELTSIVFSTMEILRQNGFSAPFEKFLSRIQVDRICENDWTMKLWPRLKSRGIIENRSVIEPDVIYESPEHYICIECKRGSSFSTKQLENERQICREKYVDDRQLYLVGISDRPVENDLAQHVNLNEEHHWQWIQWRHFYKWFMELLQKHPANDIIEFLGKTVTMYLEANNMMGFTGFDTKALWSYTAVLEHVRRASQNIGQFIEAFDEYLSEEKSEIYRRYSPQADDNKSWKAICPRADRVSYPENWIRNQYYFPYYKKGWKRRGASHALFLLFEFMDTPILRLGARINTDHLRDHENYSRHGVIETIEHFTDEFDAYQSLSTDSSVENVISHDHNNISNQSGRFLGVQNTIDQYYEESIPDKTYEKISSDLEILADTFDPFFQEKNTS